VNHPGVDLIAHLNAALADRYAVERELGRGGMATVYLAQDLKHPRAEAEARLKGALAMDSLYPLAHLYLGRVFQAEGRNQEAIAEYQRLGPLQSWVPSIAGMGYVDAVEGHRTDAMRVLAQLDSVKRTRYVTSYAVALVYTALGEKDQAFAWLAEISGGRQNLG
jgi:tetratricopeptide (TPR) repeat protein